MTIKKLTPTQRAILDEIDEALHYGNFDLAYRILDNPDNEDILDLFIEGDYDDDV